MKKYLENFKLMLNNNGELMMNQKDEMTKNLLEELDDYFMQLVISH